MSIDEVKTLLDLGIRPKLDAKLDHIRSSVPLLSDQKEWQGSIPRYSAHQKRSKMERKAWATRFRMGRSIDSQMKASTMAFPETTMYLALAGRPALTPHNRDGF
jgi:hypothetical protein